MQVFSVCGDGADALAARLAARLDSNGRVATISRVDVTPEDPRPAGVSTAYTLTDAGWSGAGDGSLSALIDRVAPDHAYAIVTGEPGARLPHVVCGDVEHAGETLYRVEDAESAAVPAIVEAVADLEPYETLESLVAQVKASERAELSGAIATFTGRVRAKESTNDAPTEYLQFEKYEGIAEERMDTISRELEERDGVLDVVMHHRTGVIEYGEDIVFVVVLAAHRGEAFQTVEDGINRLKEEVPLFKKEVTVDEEFWVHERQ
ncbi:MULTISPECIES: molybdopterin synthase [unclassified Haladaptatus]|uniref:molybdopterin synthase n=1 Tax=unclassified Haladaptatus TaxID=2622732 RepID=UPI0023E879AD|nr:MULTISPECIES: molybdopterin synthase [unclassified Haladaptatus]